MEIARFDPYLYTYCSLSTLKTMTEKGTLRFSDIRKSNDSKELVYGFNQIKKRLATLVADDRRLMDRCEQALAAGLVARGGEPEALVPVSEGGMGLCRAYDERLYAYFLKNYFDEDDLIGEEEFLGVCDFLIDRLSDIARAMRRERDGKPYDLESANILVQRCLALCFTGNGDLLSQWRGYGDDGRGVSVGFRRSDINDLLKWWDRFAHFTSGEFRWLQHGAVYYRDKDDGFTSITTEEMRHRRFMEERWELTRGNELRQDEVSLCDGRICAMLQAYLQGGLPSVDVASAMRRALWSVFRDCRDVAPLFKQRLFYEEEEERLFIWMPGGQTIDGLDQYIPQEAGRVVSGDGMLASYLDIAALKHEPMATSHLGPAPLVTVGKVVIGPRCKASEHDIATLFAGYDETPDIEHSRIPYVG